MSDDILRTLSTLDLQLDTKTINKIHDLVAAWELRQQHPIALNSQTIGVYSIAFLPRDAAAFFDIFNLTETQVRHLLQKVPAIEQDHIITSNPCNVLLVWIMHLAFQQIASVKTRDAVLMDLAKFLHYKLFTSLVNHYFCHGANEKVMNATIANLSKKFDIITYGTWKKTIEARCADLISPESIHITTLKTGGDDKKYLYIISDTQSRIRDKIKNIYAEYIATKDRGEKIDSTSAVGTDREGEKILIQTAKTLDVMIFNLQNDVQTERLFLDTQIINSLAEQFSNISADMLRTALKLLVELAKTQRDARELELVKRIDKQDIYIGMRILIENLIQKTYRYCVHTGVDVTNKAQLFIKIKNIYSSSRINDPDILQIKQSIAYLVDSFGISRRETTISSLRLAIVLYFLIKSFKYL